MFKKLFGWLVAAAIVIVAVTALALSGASKSADKSTDLSVGGSGTTLNVPDVYTAGLGLGNFGMVENFGQLVLNARQNDVAVRNTTGRTLYVRYAQSSTSGTASSSVRVYFFATTTATVAASHAYTAIVPSNLGLITGAIIATSSAASTTNSIKQAATTGQGVIVVPDGYYLHSYVQQGDLQAGCSGSVCETATSTNRGWGTLTTWFDYVYKP